MSEPVVIAAVDCETSGLHPDQHEIWEVGLIIRRPDEEDDTYHWFLDIDLTRADLIALNIGGFHERYEFPTHASRDRRQFSEDFADLTWGAHLLGANPAFDADFLGRLLRRNGQCPGWHHRLIDVQAVALGYLPRSINPTGLPLSLAKTAKHLGVPVDESVTHTALADAKLALDCYDVMIGGRK